LRDPRLHVATLTQRNHVHDQDSVLQRHELEVRELHHRPHHPVLRERLLVRRCQLLPRVGALHDRHRAQEHEQVARSEEALVGRDARDDLEVGRGRDADLALQEAEPRRGCWTEDGATVEGHAAGATELVVGEAFALDELLGHGVAGREEDGGGDGLGEERARGQLGLVPAWARSLANVSSVHGTARDLPAQHLGRSVSLSAGIVRGSFRGAYQALDGFEGNECVVYAVSRADRNSKDMYSLPVSGDSMASRWK